MYRLKPSALARDWWPSDAPRTVGGAVLLAAGAGLASGGVAWAGLGAAAAIGGAGLLVSALRRQAAAERLVADLPMLAAPGASHAERLAEVVDRIDALLRRSTNTHPITGMGTREPLVEAMAADIAGGRGARLLGAVRFTDFDRLAAFDPPAANDALKRFAGRLVAATRPSHVVGQIDRDCFCVWFRGADNAETASAELRAIAYVAGQELVDGDAVLTPTIEVGVAAFPTDGADAAHLLLRVTAALSRPGVAGPGEVALAAPPSVEAAREQFMLEQDLAQAIAEDQLTMVFQPVIDLAAGRLIGAEALLRWEHPRLGSVSPARFVPIVEAIGMSERYGLWVLNTACRQARLWRDEGFADLKVAVNLSAKQLLDPNLKAKIERTLQRHALDPRALELELTETAAMVDAGRTRVLFGELRAMGVSLAIDDFGSGYSSLSYLKNLPFDKLKIDREFVTDIHARRDSQAICKALIELGRGLDLAVLAEGVETEAETDALRALGCTIFQGYRFSRPLSADDFRRFARDSAWPARRVRGGPSSPTRSFRPQDRLSV